MFSNQVEYVPFVKITSFISFFSYIVLAYQTGMGQGTNTPPDKKKFKEIGEIGGKLRKRREDQ